MFKYLILDVDGTLTDGGIYYDENGNETKKFSAKDGTGIVCTKTAGIKVVVITGRKCQATHRRMTELKVDYLYQDVKDKAQFLADWLKEHQVQQSETAYIGDDINDIASMKLCGFTACPADAIDEVKSTVDYVSSVNGGEGVVRDVIKYILKKENLWDEVLNKAYGTGI